MSNKLAVSNILFIYQSLLVTHSEYIFCCFLLHLFVCLCKHKLTFACVTRVHLYLHLGNLVLFAPFVYVVNVSVCLQMETRAACLWLTWGGGLPLLVVGIYIKLYV